MSSFTKDCIVHQFSSRGCSRGTKGCDVEHLPATHAERLEHCAELRPDFSVVVTTADGSLIKASWTTDGKSRTYSIRIKDGRYIEAETSLVRLCLATILAEDNRVTPV